MGLTAEVTAPSAAILAGMGVGFSGISFASKAMAERSNTIMEASAEKKAVTRLTSKAVLQALAKLSSAQTKALNMFRASGIQSILKPGYIIHLTDVIEFAQSTAIKGGHNKVKFFEYLRKNNILINEIARNKSAIDGVEEIIYKIPSKNSAGKILKDASGNIIWKNQEFRKTIFDPAIISEEEMISMGEQAMKEGLNSVRLTFQNSTNTIIDAVAPNGLKFKGYWNSITGEIENFQPVMEW